MKMILKYSHDHLCGIIRKNYGLLVNNEGQGSHKNKTNDAVKIF